VTVTALVTGASSGIGAEFARQLASRGADVVLVARDRDALERLGSQLSRTYGVGHEVLAADLTHHHQLARVADRLADPARPIEVLVNSAGHALPLDFAANDIDAEQRHLDIHVGATMRLSHAALRAMLVRGHGRIINVSSVSAFMPRGTYGAVKAWVVSFSRWANGAYRDRGVTVTAVCPGFTHTNFHERAGLPPGQEGIAPFLWLNARDVVSEALRDAARGAPVSIPSLRYKIITALARLAPAGLVAAAAARGR
jgi:uncharacterized protein